MPRSAAFGTVFHVWDGATFARDGDTTIPTSIQDGQDVDYRGFFPAPEMTSFYTIFSFLTANC